MPEQAQVIQPSPTPITFGVQQVMGNDGQKIVVLVQNGPNGQWVSFMSIEGAKEMARQLTEASSGLTIAQPGTMLNGQHG